MDCFKVAVSRLGPDLVGRIMNADNGNSVSASRDNQCGSSSVRVKNSMQEYGTAEAKSQKVQSISTDTDAKNGNFLSVSGDNGYMSSKAGVKRPIQEMRIVEAKRQKFFESSYQDEPKLVSTSTGVRETKYADLFCTSLNLLVKILEPPGEHSNLLMPEVAMVAISSLCIVFSEYPHTDLTYYIYQQMRKWIYWMSEQVCCFLVCRFDYLHSVTLF